MPVAFKEVRASVQKANKSVFHVHATSSDGSVGSWGVGIYPEPAGSEPLMLRQSWRCARVLMQFATSGALPSFFLLLLYVYLVPCPTPNLEHCQVQRANGLHRLLKTFARSCLGLIFKHVIR